MLQVDFKMEGPFGVDMVEAFKEVAQSINEEDGFIWKIWTESPETKEAGGIYSFETRETAEKYLAMHTKRLAGFGMTDINAKILSVNTALSQINNGPIK